MVLASSSVVTQISIERTVHQLELDLHLSGAPERYDKTEEVLTAHQYQ